MGKLIGYDNHVWRVLHDFKYTGTDQPFTLTPGKYLFICKGGASDSRSINKTTGLMFGGISMGVLDLSTQTTFHAVVGGNSITNETDILTNPSPGGFNGGSPGSKKNQLGSYNNTINGIGGGGASDIRLLAYDPAEYPTYEADGTFHEPAESPIMLGDNAYYRLEYLRSLGLYNQNNTDYNTSYILTDYIPTNHTKVVFDGVVFSANTRTSATALFGSQDTNSGKFCFYIKINSLSTQTYFRYSTSQSFNNFTYDQHINLVCFQDTAKWYINDVLQGSVTIPDCVPDSGSPGKLCLFGNCVKNDNNVMEYGSNSQLFGFKVYEVDPDTHAETLIRDYVPAQRVSDNVLGVYDLKTNTFCASNNSGGLIPGPKKRNSPSINSRIIVAGGAGGQLPSSLGYSWPTAYGGGPASLGCTSSGENDPNANIRINQTCGYAFGYAQNVIGYSTSTANTPRLQSGSAGSGGGWFGGLARLSSYNNATNYATCGSGGSGYVLTSTSYKPAGYTPSSAYYMTNVYMGTGQSEEGEIIVAKLGSYKAGDTIEFYSIGKTNSIDLRPGTYQLKCYGAGSFSTIYHNDIFAEENRYLKGGYAQGTLQLSQDAKLYVNVGGRGMSTALGGKVSENTPEYAAMIFPYNGFNGGGIPNATNPRTIRGGGATDMRIENNTLYDRIIVAGGAGSEGIDTGQNPPRVNLGFNGGGEVGGGQKLNGIVNSPSTDRAAPSDQYPQVAGSFGQGGFGSISAGRYFSGSGGGGWYGGSGAKNSNYYWGNGGSGYVLTSNSYKPPGYNVDDKYMLTNTVLTSGGNTSYEMQGHATIEVLSTTSPILIQDADGYKHFDASSNQWALITPQPSTITASTFDTYPDSFFLSEEGLNGDCVVYIRDDNETASNVYVNGSPKQTHIEIKADKVINPLFENVDDTVTDPTAFTTSYTYKDDEETGYLKACIDITKVSTNADDAYRLYTILITGKDIIPNKYKYWSINDVPNTSCLPNNPCYGTMIKNRGEIDDYIDSELEENLHYSTSQWLLTTKISGSESMSSQYYSDLTDDGVTGRYSCICAECNRIIYIMMTIRKNSSDYLQIKSFNPTTNAIALEYESTIDTFNNNYRQNGFLVDDKYFYIKPTRNNPDKLYRINRRTHEMTTISLSYQGITTSNYRGFMYWENKNRNRIVFVDSSNVVFFNVKTALCEDVYTIATNCIISDFAIGDQKIFFVTTSGATNNIVWMDRNTFEITRTTINNVGTFNAMATTYSDGKFYLAACNGNIFVIDETTCNVTDTINSVTGWVSSIARIQNTLFVTPMTNINNSDHYMRLVNLTDNSVQYSYQPYKYSTYSNGSNYEVYRMQPIVFQSLYIDPAGYPLTVIICNTNAKYKIGNQYNQYLMEANLSNIDNITCDDVFVTLTENHMVVMDGDKVFPIVEYSSDHVGHTDLINRDIFSHIYGVYTT